MKLTWYISTIGCFLAPSGVDELAVNAPSGADRSGRAFAFTVKTEPHLGHLTLRPTSESWAFKLRPQDGQVTGIGMDETWFAPESNQYASSFLSRRNECATSILQTLRADRKRASRFW